MRLHQHLVDEHTDAVVRKRGDVRPRNRVWTPKRSTSIAVRAEAGIEDDETLERFSNEVTMLVFDKLLNRVEEED
ncbi:MAG: hypothetical protein U5J64_00780 [Halobacteriales archaeon]|nr:hypothetical protein [Halobacteriales archaeon]